MGKPDADNLVQDMSNAVTELYKVADMAEIIIEAIFNGDAVTLQTVGNSMDVFLSQLRERIVRVEMLNEMISSRFSWVYDGQGGGADRYYIQEFEEYLSGGKEAEQEPDDLESYDNIRAFVKLLPEEQREKLYNLLEKISAASRKRGFIEGYRAADSRCAGSGGDNRGRA